MIKKIIQILIAMILLILSILIIPLASAITCSDTFLSNSPVISVCGYCLESNGSICSPATFCNVTIYNTTMILVMNKTTSNYHDGSMIYNITQYDGINKNLSDGTYYGELYCGARSHDTFSFIVSTQVSLGGGWNVGGITNINQIPIFINQTNKIPNDIKDYLDFSAGKLIPPNKDLAKIIIIILLLILIFITEIIKLVRIIKAKW